MQLSDFLYFSGGRLIKQDWHSDSWQVAIDEKSAGELDISIKNDEFICRSDTKPPVFTVIVDGAQQLKLRWTLGGNFTLRWIFTASTNTSSDRIECQDEIDLVAHANVAILHELKAKNLQLTWQRQVYIAKNGQLTWFNWIDEETNCVDLHDEMVVHLSEEKSEFWARVGQKLPTSSSLARRNWQIIHQSSNTQSRVTTKSVLSNGAQTRDRCLVIVEPSALAASTKVYHHALLLDDLSKAEAAPELEVYCEEVNCLHGATSGHPDEDALFYLASRGIAAPEATSLVVEGFLAEVKLPQELI